MFVKLGFSLVRIYKANAANTLNNIADSLRLMSDQKNVDGQNRNREKTNIIMLFFILKPLHIKYRPKTFDECYGNQSMIDSLKTILSREGIAKPKTYLFKA